MQCSRTSRRVRGGIGFAIGSAVGVLGSLLIVKKIEGDMSCFLLTKEECAVAKPQPLTITPKTGLRIAMVAAVTGAVGATIGAFKEEC